MVKAKDAVEDPVAVVYEEDLKEQYWMGTLPESPFQNLTIGGQTFHRQTEIVMDGVGIRTQRTIQLGLVASLFKEEVETIKTKIKNSMIRKGNPATIFDKTKKTPRMDDRPLGDFIYFIRVNDAPKMLGSNWRTQLPSSYSGQK